MARNHEPVTDAAIAEAREAIAAQRVEIREVLAAELGGDPGDYRAEAYLQEQDADRVDDHEARPDGGE